MSQAQPTTVRQPARVGSSQRRMDMTARLRRLGGARSAVQTIAHAAVVQAYEAALLLSAVATAPARLVHADSAPANRMSPQANVHATRTRPVLLVHGFGGDKSSWTLVAHALGDRGLTVDTMNYAPVGNSVEQIAERLVAEVEKTLSRTGAEKVDLVGHSLGGVIIAQAISDPRMNGLVDTVITLGSPFGGSPWAGVLPVVEIVRALRPGSPLLRRLASTPLPDGVRWLSVTAALDIIVPGLRSVPSHAQVETITFNGVGHLGMLLSQRVIGCITAALCADRTAAADEPANLQLQSAC
ncbi:esterase/lipase family protein [Mycobacterium sp.]|uniref:esterase/lipase family protein n=2 Tax=Mycobacterium sp. TaxID=1785 RepID=UPI003F96E091